MKSFEPFDITLERRNSGSYYGEVPGTKGKCRFCEKDLHYYFNFPQREPVIHLHVTSRKAKTRYRVASDGTLPWSRFVKILLIGDDIHVPEMYPKTRQALSKILLRLEDTGYEIYVGMEIDNG